MKTLIELFDERPLENIIGTETFLPERTVFICPPGIMSNKSIQNKLREYFAHRGVKSECVFIGSSMLSAAEVSKTLTKVLESYPDCVLDITGGSESALFAAGLVCSGKTVPVLTYSRTQNCFFNVMNAGFAHKLDCGISISVEDCFLMAGGRLRTGRVDNSVLGAYSSYFDRFFDIYMQNRNEWNSFVSFMQHATGAYDESLSVDAPWQVHSRGRVYTVNKKLLSQLEELGFVKNLSIDDGNGASFEFADSRIKAWLRDVGSVLELYVYHRARCAGCFNDVVTSAVVDWENDGEKDPVTNEIDVMATCGVVPVFISCKTCDVKTEAINELAVLRDRFGGKMAKAAIVTTEPSGTAARKRADELNISIIDLYDIEKGALDERLMSLSQPEI